MDFTGRLTVQGAALLATALAKGSPLSITRVVAGSGVTGDEDPVLAQPRQEAPISTRTTDGAVATIMVTLSASMAEEAYSLTELGVYARDSVGQEILYQVFRLDTPVYISPDSRLVLRTFLRMALSDDLKVVLSFPPSGLLIEEDIATKADLVCGQVPYEQTPVVLSSGTWYVNADTGSDENSGLSAELPKATIEGALQAIPKNLGGKTCYIYLHGGTIKPLQAGSSVNIEGYYNGSLVIDGAGMDSEAKILGDMNVNVSAIIWLLNLHIESNLNESSWVGVVRNGGAGYLCMDGCVIDAVSKTNPCVRSNYGGFISAINTVFQNGSYAVDMEGRDSYHQSPAMAVIGANCSGRNNSYGIRSSRSIVFDLSRTAIGDTQYVKRFGGLVVNDAGNFV